MSQLSAIGHDLPVSRGTNLRDGLGVAASVLCAIHCAAMPFVIGFLPLLGLSFLADPAFHQWMVAICLGLALLAFVPGWRRHRRWTPTIIGLVGLSLISFAAFAGPEDCCAGACTTTPGTTQTAAMTVPGPDAAACTATCCDSAGGEETNDPNAPTVATAACCSETTPAAEEACTASCCGSETSGPASDMTVMVASTAVVDDEEEPCSKSCCSEASETDTVIVASLVEPVVEGDGACTAACCPESEDALPVVTAGIGGFADSEFMRLVWLWMTPIGGVILVIAHLTNHRLTGTCKAACCTGDADAGGTR